MICRERRKPTPRHVRAALAAVAGSSLLIAPIAARAGDVSEVFVNPFTTPSWQQWGGLNFGGHYGFANMHTDFGSSTSSAVAYILRNSTLQNEAAPSTWTALPAKTTSSHGYGLFLGYNYQWDQLVLGVDGTYNRLSNLQAAASDGLTRIVTTSDNVQHTVTIAASSSMKVTDYGTFRVRAGYAVGQFLPYAFVGGAVARFSSSSSATVTDVQDNGGVITTFGPITQSDNRNSAVTGGFTAGLGIDVAILPNMFLRAEWEFVGLAQVNGIRSTINTGRIGLGLKF